jgi:hypothetical protein
MFDTRQVNCDFLRGSYSTRESYSTETFPFLPAELNGSVGSVIPLINGDLGYTKPVVLWTQSETEILMLKKQL